LWWRGKNKVFIAEVKENRRGGCGEGLHFHRQLFLFCDICH